MGADYLLPEFYHFGREEKRMLFLCFGAGLLAGTV
jgi:hypothetical protein